MTLDEIREAIRRELESLRASGARRQELSLHACKRLFFDLGIRPSAANVRDLTQTGSASDIPKDIDHFWERIRAASKIKLDGAAIPKAVEEKAGALLTALYDEALKAAKESLDGDREQIRSSMVDAEQRLRDAAVRQETLEAALARSENRNDQLQARLTELEVQLASQSTHGSANEATLLATITRLEKELAATTGRVDAEQTQNAALRDRIDALQAELQQRTEHYAQQIKDAVAEAERRVKPMLVELDSLRSMASTYQSGLRDVQRKEFDFLQQLSAAKARADRLEEQLRSQSDELERATRDANTLRASRGMSPEISALMRRLADAGQLDADAFSAIGTSLDDEVPVPSRCPRCDGEPELSHGDNGFEVSCPECDHASGFWPSRFEAATRFARD
ncbi:DNA-binding protein [Burkholderia vietnamiensis]|uniref:DNA-binding protein n=1 Tax=Burkholderia vietnamiensis TaxID=60552 RepID=UPI000757FB01|nr:DNA-binding protein [Burkholderia vietnamiensis]AOK44288.1 DNA-binding protein [Burkholderia vietnamiensis]KVF38322.1 DNA-binding protein [Burkholderia vietnamiensis]KVF96425.1 DNA-binding protein [Burkholderia vietnamiensis]KVR82034.1 DNA-binding protein [Burkholderia vietnamiensis]MBR8192003.1 DNA-binding protein [Burkholderia vietnamiensis]